MCNINSALGVQFNLLSFMWKLFNGKLNKFTNRPKSVVEEEGDGWDGEEQRNMKSKQSVHDEFSAEYKSEWLE